MKRFIIIFALATGFMSQAAAQEYEYIPIVREGVQWVYYQVLAQNSLQEQWSYDVEPFIYEFKGDTVVRNTTYKKLYIRRANPKYDGKDEFCVALAHENREKGVYAIIQNPSWYNYHPIMGKYELARDENINPCGIDNHLIYDFALGEYYIFSQTPMLERDRDDMFTIKDWEYVEIAGKLRKRYNTSKPYRYIIEGIGYVVSGYPEYMTEDSETLTKDQFLYYLRFAHPIADFIQLNPRCSTTHWFSHVIEDGQIVYKGEFYDNFQRIFPEFSEAVSVQDIHATTVASEDGKSPIFDLQGRVVTGTPAPGIYVKQGKKVVVE